MYARYYGKHIDTGSLEIKKYLEEIPVDRSFDHDNRWIVGNLCLEIFRDGKVIAKYGLAISDVQDIIEIAGGAKKLAPQLKEETGIW
ncbi:MAG: hypothetical protein ACP5VS_17880 [Desulfomonilaceae bacterium]